MRTQHGVWLIAAALITALSLLLVFVPGARAEQSPQVIDELQQSQIYNGDLEVESGQVIEGDANVYNGDVVVRRDGRIQGNLNVYSGDVELEDGGRVDGNITSWSGDLQIDGRVDGSVAAMSGDVEVDDGAFIGGDISVMAGHIKQRAGAEVGGNILRGPDLKLPGPPAINLAPWMNAPQAPDAPFPPDRDGFTNRPLGFVGRALTALLLLGLFVAGAAALAALRPSWTRDVQDVLGRQAALSFATGLIANVLMLAVIGFLFITICLRPPALLLAVGMLGFNVAGMAAVGSEIGGRLSERMSGQWTPTSRTALGVVVPGAIIAFLWAIGGCFAFFAGMGALLLGSFGVGAILVKALNLGSQATIAPAPSSGPAGQTPSPAGSGASPAVVTDSQAAVQAPVVPAANERAVDDIESAQPAVIETPAQVVESPSGEPPVTQPEQWWASADAVQANAATSEEAGDAARADFTQIEGIGPKLSERLHAANIHTFADLAELPPETLAGILGWTSERLLRSRILEQARDLAK